jgi:hypothetical protein
MKPTDIQDHRGDRQLMQRHRGRVARDLNFAD